MSRRLPHSAPADWARYIATRLLQGVVVLWAAFTIAFVVLYLLPSDPVRIMLAGSGAEFANADDDDIAALRAEYGLDQPAFVQYVRALGGAVTGNLGRSIQRGMPVTDLLGEAVGQTLVLGGVALVLAVVIGFAVAVLANLVPSRALRQFLLALPPLAVAVPGFWLGLLLTQVFAFGLRWVNIFDQTSWAALVLPAITLAVPTSAFIAQVLAKSLAQTLREPYVDVIRSRGASESRAVLRGAVRNASLPLFTMLGMIVGNVLAGSVVVETVFSRMGVGRVTYEAVNAQDIPVVMGVVMLAAITFVVISLVVDLLYPLLDPRVSVRTARPARARATAREGALA